MIASRYLALIDRTLDAYSPAEIEAYFARVRRDGLTEHGFPRLCANLGVLIAHGRRPALIPLFCAMMDFCCDAIPRVVAANEFSVREVVLAIRVLDGTGAVDPARIARWQNALRTLDPATAYQKIARTPADRPHNWACFAALSEFVRGQALGIDTAAFVDLQLASQLPRFDENGMYRDPHTPMVYDLVSRALLALLLTLGYRGSHREAIDAHLRTAGRLTLAMQSTTGEIPYGGRSAQFLHNEAVLAIVLEYEARRYAAAGDLPTAGRFKQGVDRALTHLEGWLARTPISHAKNRFPRTSGYGCEGYAYFEKYMVTAASFLYAAALIGDDTIPLAPPDDAPAALSSSSHFHKLFLRAGDYFAELDLAADPHYDASGLGRVHRAGLPSALCLSLPAPSRPKFTVDTDAPLGFAICPALWLGGVWQDGSDATYTVAALTQTDTQAQTVLTAPIAGREARMTVTLTPAGVTVTAEAADGGAVGLMLPALAFDGETYADLSLTDTALHLTYRGGLYRAVTDGRLTDTARLARNRNGHYRVLRAEGIGAVTAQITLERSNTP